MGNQPFPKYVIRPFCPNDVGLYSKQCKNLDDESGFSVAHPDCWDWENTYYFGLFHYTKLIGYCTIGDADVYEDEAVCKHPLYTPKSYLLSDVYITPEFRNKGLGTKMVEDAIAYKRCHDGNQAVFIDVLDEDIVSFYEKIGFEPIYSDNGTFSYSMVQPKFKN